MRSSLDCGRAVWAFYSGYCWLTYGSITLVDTRVGWWVPWPAWCAVPMLTAGVGSVLVALWLIRRMGG